jgi:cell division protein FtsN
MAKKQQAFRGGDEPRAWPAWAWLLAGVGLGLGVSAVALYRDWLPALRNANLPQPNPVATAPQSGEPDVATEAARAAEAKPKYDFYSVLPEMEVVIPDSEVQQQAAAPDATAAGAQRLLLQAGSFRSATDAEAMKARLALMGLRAQVVTVTINDATWHRVRVGPYLSARELDDAKRTLESNGIRAIALRETAP